MFLKPFRVKSQTQIKGSDRKKLRTDLGKHFSTLTAADISDLIPNKEDMTVTKVYTFKGDSLLIYSVAKEPLFFEVDKEKEMLPTVYAMWRYPNILPTFTTDPPVVARLAGGADLMLPGIVLPRPIGLKSYGDLRKGDHVSINLTTNRAPVSIGRAALSSEDMYMAARHGRGVFVMHAIGDHLWQMGSQSSPPELPPPSRISRADASDSEEEDNEILDAEEFESTEDLHEVLEAVSLHEDPEEAASLDFEEEAFAKATPEDMDRLLEHCFLKAWKTSAKHIELPILTSNFYRLHMIPACPDGHSLDVKKSTHKKLSKFLLSMSKRNFVTVKEFPKGIENITEYNFAHEEVKSFTFDPHETTEKPVASGEGGFVPPVMEEVYQVSGQTLGFFRSIRLERGKILTQAEIRQIVTNYIKNENLQKPGEKQVTLDPYLAEAVLAKSEYREQLRWDEIFSRMLGKMAPAVRITRRGYPQIIRKGKLEPIELVVASRMGNKKVTLIYNAHIYGIDEHELAHQIQVGVAASTAVGPAEHKPKGTTQVLVQGNQIKFIAKLLLETYKVPKKYIRGLELAGKDKKKKK